MASPVDELVICRLAAMLKGAGVVACGSSSPLQAAASLLAQALDPAGVRALIFRNPLKDPFHESGSEVYDQIGQGRIDVFFLSAGQIDGEANLNNIGVGPYPATPVRFPGSFGLPYIYLMCPRVILYREEHSPRSLVQKVDFITAPGRSPPGVYRRGGPTDLVTSLAAFTFDPAVGRFTLASVHPGHSVAEIVARTGFDFDHSDEAPATPAPEPAWLDLLYGAVRDKVAETYPEFAAERLEPT